MKRIAPQLATAVDEVPVGAEWWFETKYDGYRMHCYAIAGTIHLISRNGLDWTDRFQEIAKDLKTCLKSRTLLLDGEIIIDAKGRSSFHALQNSLSDETTAKAKFVVFDLLFDRGVDLRKKPLRERRAALDMLSDKFAASRRIALSRKLRGAGSAALNVACKRGEEGIIAKRADSTYESGRTRTWLKIKCGRRQEFVVVGYSEPKGSRTGIGALLLGVYDGSQLQYSGRVGTGFSDRDLIDLRKRLEKLGTPRPPLTDAQNIDAVREHKKVHWVKPSIVVEVSFTEWTPDALLRHPVFHGIREDKKAKQVRREDK